MNMATLQQEKKMRDIARLLEKKLKQAYGVKMSFLLVTQPYGEGDKVSDYIGNLARESGIGVLRETADRLERNETIPAAQGEA
jgi:hypothetical protein